LRRVGAGAVGGREPLVELFEVADQGQREQLLLAGEVPVDDRPVDADSPGDVLDLRVPNAARVEQRAGGVEDLLLAAPAACGRGGAPPVEGAPSAPSGAGETLVMASS
jgi:hypothetical protein